MGLAGRGALRGETETFFFFLEHCVEAVVVVQLLPRPLLFLGFCWPWLGQVPCFPRQ